MKLLLATLVASLTLAPSLPASDGTPSGEAGTAAGSFAERVDLEPLGTVAVHSEGRLKSFASYAAEKMGFVTGPREIDGRSDVFTYLDMLFRPDAYQSVPCIFVKNKNVRARLIDVLGETPLRSSPDFVETMEFFLERGLIAPELLEHPAVVSELEQMERDLIRTARDVNKIHGALTWRQPRVLAGNLAMLPPVDTTGPDGELVEADETMPWTSLPLVIDTRALGPARAPYAGDAAAVERLQQAWSDLETAWPAGDATTVNAAVATFADVLPTLNPELYPPLDRLQAEAWYFDQDNMTWVWMVYFLGALVLLMGIVYHWKGTLRAGLAIFGVAVALHTVSLGLRWWISQRWPNSNMYEAVTTAAWFGAFGAIFLEYLARKTRMRGAFAFTSAVGSMVALMAARFLPLQLNPSIGNMMPVLDDIWLLIHTNVIIWSYALIFAAAIAALIYLGWRLKLRLTGEMRGVDHARNGGAGALMMATAVGAGTATGSDPDMAMATDTAAVESSVQGGAVAAAGTSTLGQTLDGVTMLLMEVSFVMLWAGIAMGAIWADHSWGRPWGWDPKEVYALNTFLVFAVLVHVRIKAKDKGLWTAVLAIVGAAVMMFNWIVINFVISGLHSYA